ncbi:YjdF family protein [Paenibacillus macerans]|uniref:YjdF family protein n=1 Tax=Paenibacillus macerans TaxID=44252 RepID=UPI002795336F|nr:YjdF family protein [Paenibacillus macerans]
MFALKLTIYHDGQYWIGVFEERSQGKLRAGRRIFGAEPKDEEVLAFIRSDLSRLLDGISQGVAIQLPDAGRVNPKRLARQAAAELKRRGASTMAYEAMRLEYEQRKQAKRSTAKEQREAERERKREIKIRKAKAKRRGH